MSWAQLIYTSSPIGSTRSAGFQIFSQSADIAATDSSALERLTLYDTPTDAPPQPTEAELEEAFPLLFAAVLLPSGKLAVFESRYIGTDYSGRYGNYFAHAFIASPETFPRRPIDYMGSPSFRRRLRDEELALTEPPPPLPAVSLAPSDLPVAADLERFLSIGERRALLAQMLNALLKFPTTRKPVLLVDEPENVHLWFVAIYAALPLTVGRKLGCATYVTASNRFDCPLQASLASGTAISFHAHDTKERFQIFNLPEQLVPPVDAVLPVALFAARNVFTKTATLREFHALAESLSSSLGLAEMGRTFDLFLLKDNQAEGQVTDDALRDALVLAETHGSEHSDRMLFPRLISLATDRISGATAGKLIALVSEMAVRSRNPDQGRAARAFSLRIIRRFLLENATEAGVAPVLFKTAAASSALSAAAFIRTEEGLSAWATWATLRPPVGCAARALREALEILLQTEAASSLYREQRSIQNLLAALMLAAVSEGPKAAAELRSLPIAPDFLSQIVVSARQSDRGASVLGRRAFPVFLAQLLPGPPYQPMVVELARNLMDAGLSVNAETLLLETACVLMEESCAPGDTLAFLWSAWLAEEKPLQATFLPELIAIFCRRMHQAAPGAGLTVVLAVTENFAGVLSEKALDALLLELEHHRPGVARLAALPELNRLSALCRQLGAGKAKALPPVLSLAVWLETLQRDPVQTFTSDTTGLALVAARLSPADYKELLDWSLPKAFSGTGKEPSFKGIIQGLASPAHREVFVSVFFSHVAWYGRRQRGLTAAFLRFWNEYRKSAASGSEKERLSELARPQLERLLLDLPRREFEALRKELDHPNSRYWPALFAHAETARSRSFSHRAIALLSWPFRRLFRR